VAMWLVRDYTKFQVLRRVRTVRTCIGTLVRALLEQVLLAYSVMCIVGKR